MKKHKYIISLSLLLSAIFFHSCLVDRVTTEIFRSYVYCYYDSDEINLELTKTGNICMYAGKPTSSYKWRSKGAMKELYDSLCMSHNDMDYNTKISYIVSLTMEIPGGEQSKRNIQKIDVLSNADFDEAHPAGTLLNDVVSYLGSTIRPFIDSGYKQTYDWTSESSSRIFKESIDRSEAHFPIDKKLNEIEESDFLLTMSSGSRLGVLVFDAEPTLSKEHEITVKIQLSGGKVFEVKIEKIFE